MRSILVVNPKGGSGKTTIATHLAAFFAAHGKRIVLADMDRQQSGAQLSISMSFWAKRKIGYCSVEKADSSLRLE